MSSSRTVLVTILGKEYQIACSAGEEQALTRAARELDKRMQEVRNSGKVIGLERIAVMVALNLSYELGQMSHEHQTLNEDSLQRITEKLDSALAAKH